MEREETGIGSCEQERLECQYRTLSDIVDPVLVRGTDALEAEANWARHDRTCSLDWELRTPMRHSTLERRHPVQAVLTICDYCGRRTNAQLLHIRLPPCG